MEVDHDIGLHEEGNRVPSKQQIAGLSKLTKVIETISYYINSIGAVFLSLMFLSVTIAVFFRYVLKTPILGINDIQMYMFLLVVFSSLAYCWNKDGHITMDLFTRRFGIRGKACSKFLSSFIGVIFFGMMVIGSSRQIGLTLESGATSPEIGIPEWPFHLLMAILAALFVLQLLATMINSIVILLRGAE